MKVKIRIDTLTDAKEFVNITSKLDTRISVMDNDGHVVNAKSMLGMLYSMEFNNMWCYSDEDIYSYIEKFII